MKKQYPITTVGALIINPKKEVLLIKTHKWTNKYGIPGGKIDMGETCEEALIREIKEETNLKISNIKFITIIDSVYSEEFYKKKHMILLNYTCETSGTDVKLNEEAQSYVWATIEEALTMDLNTATRKLITLYDEQN